MTPLPKRAPSALLARVGRPWTFVVTFGAWLIVSAGLFLAGPYGELSRRAQSALPEERAWTSSDQVRDTLARLGPHGRATYVTFQASMPSTPLRRA